MTGLFARGPGHSARSNFGCPHALSLRRRSSRSGANEGEVRTPR